MKGIFLTAAAILFFVITATCQITQGNWLVGGSASFSSTKYNSSASIPGTSTTVEVNPNVGYFIADKFAAGVSGSITNIKTSSSHVQLFQVGPFVRYYILPAEQMVNIFTELNYQYGSSNNPLRHTSTFSFFAGPVIYFNENVGMEFSIGYSSLKYETYTGRDNTIQVGIGFQIHLKKDTK